MSIGSVESVFYTLAFIVPGFVLRTTLATLVPQGNDRTELSFIRFLTLSCLNYAIWSWLVYVLLTEEFFTAHAWRSAAAWAWIVVGSPVLIGLLLGRLSQRDSVRRVLQRMGFNPIHMIPTAWDYKFSRTPPVWVLVTLKDGSMVAGWFGSASFASSEPDGHDLYVEQVFKITGSEKWQRVPGTEGILILGEQIRHVEFWSDNPPSVRLSQR